MRKDADPITTVFRDMQIRHCITASLRHAFAPIIAHPIRRRAMEHHQSGRHFLQIPGPTNVPDRVLRAIDNPTVDHRGPEFQEMSKEVLAGLKQVFRTTAPVVIFPASGTGAWEAALVNTLSPGNRVLMYET